MPDEKYPYRITAAYESGDGEEDIAQLADASGAYAAYAALLDQYPENKWLTLTQRGKRVKHERATGKWHREFAQRIGVME